MSSSSRTVVPPSIPPPTMVNTGIQANTSSTQSINNPPKVINATLSRKTTNPSATTTTSNSRKKPTSLDFLYNGSVHGLPPMRKPTIRNTKSNEWLPAPSANNSSSAILNKSLGIRRGETAKGNSTTEDIEKLLARPSVHGGMKKGGSGDHTFPRYGVVDVEPGIRPTKPRKNKIKMVKNNRPERLGPKPKLFDWKWPDPALNKVVPGSEEDQAYWRSMAQPKRYLKPDWARDPHGPKEQYW